MQRVKRSPRFHLLHPGYGMVFDCFDLMPLERNAALSLEASLAEVFADHFDADVAGGPFFTVELDSSESLEVSEVFA